MNGSRTRCRSCSLTRQQAERQRSFQKFAVSADSIAVAICGSVTEFAGYLLTSSLIERIEQQSTKEEQCENQKQRRKKDDKNKTEKPQAMREKERPYKTRNAADLIEVSLCQKCTHLTLLTARSGLKENNVGAGWFPSSGASQTTKFRGLRFWIVEISLHRSPLGNNQWDVP